MTFNDYSFVFEVTEGFLMTLQHFWRGAGHSWVGMLSAGMLLAQDSESPGNLSERQRCLCQPDHTKLNLSHQGFAAFSN